MKVRLNYSNERDSECRLREISTPRSEDSGENLVSLNLEEIKNLLDRGYTVTIEECV